MLQDIIAVLVHTTARSLLVNQRNFETNPVNQVEDSLKSKQTHTLQHVWVTLLKLNPKTFNKDLWL